MVGGAILCLQRRYTLGRLLGVVLMVGIITTLPFYFTPLPTYGGAHIRFTPSLSEDDMQALCVRLSPESFAAWMPKDSSPTVSIEELRSAGYNAGVSSD